jgi:hypothetical protein
MLCAIGFVVWLWFCVAGLGVGELPGNGLGQPPAVGR